MIDAYHAAIRFEPIIGRLAYALAEQGKTAAEIEQVAAEIERAAAQMTATGMPISPYELGNVAAQIMKPPPSRIAADDLARLKMRIAAKEATRGLNVAPNRHQRRREASPRWRRKARRRSSTGCARLVMLYAR